MLIFKNTNKLKNLIIFAQDARLGNSDWTAANAVEEPASRINVIILLGNVRVAV